MKVYQRAFFIEIEFFDGDQSWQGEILRSLSRATDDNLYQYRSDTGYLVPIEYR